MGNSLTRCCRRLRSRGDENLYSVLGVAPTASYDEIRAAMRRLTFAHGPGSGGDYKLFQQAKRAYVVLSDPQIRAQYDVVQGITSHVIKRVDAFDGSTAMEEVEDSDPRDALLGKLRQRKAPKPRGEPVAPIVKACDEEVSAQLQELDRVVAEIARVSREMEGMMEYQSLLISDTSEEDKKDDAVILRSEYVSMEMETIDPHDGFQAAKTSSGLWNESPLLANRIASDQLTVGKLLFGGDYGDAWLGQYGDRQVVVKELKMDQLSMAEAIVWATEIVRMTQINHPKVTTFLGVEWTTQTKTHAVVEYLPLGDLRTLLSSSKAADLDWADFKCEAAIDVVDALAYLQASSLAVKMDSFSSRNVLLEDKQGHCKLSIFAASRGRWDLYSRPYYYEWVAPEIIVETANRDPIKSAIYSLGVLLCELDTIKRVFYDALNPDGSPMSSAKIAQLVAMRKLRPSVSGKCPEGIALLASECLAFDPQARPTAASIAYRLRDVLKNEL